MINFKLIIIFVFIKYVDAKCVSLPDDKVSGLTVARSDPESVLVNFKENVTLNCNSNGRNLRSTASSTFRQCKLMKLQKIDCFMWFMAKMFFCSLFFFCIGVYDPKIGYPDYWLSGAQPNCPRADCGESTIFSINCYM